MATHISTKKPSASTPKMLKSTKTNATKSGLPLPLALLIALLAGLGFSLALAPHYLYPLAIISPMVLYALLVGEENSRRAFWLGEFYGFGTWLVGAFWLYTSIHQYGGIADWLAMAMIVAMAIVMGLFHAVMSWLFVRYMGRQPLAFAGLWVVQEWCKTWLLTGFPWLFVGYAFTEVSWLNGLAPIAGVFGLSFLAVLFGAATIELFRQRGGYMAIAATLTALTVIISWQTIDWTKKTGDNLSVSLVQGNIPQDLKWLTEYRLEGLNIYTQLSESELGRDLLIWPEAAITFFQDDAELFLNGFSDTAKQAGTTWITGIPYRDGASGKMYNGVMSFDEQTGIYRKQNLVPFGEYIPFQGMLNLLPNMLNLPDSFSKGSDNQAALMVKNQQMGVAICYEVAYPATTRNNAKNSDFLLTVSNDAWFGTSAGPMQHLQMVQMRSLETGRWFVRATNNGVTAIIDHHGKVVSSVPQFERTVLRGEVESRTGNTPYMILGSLPILILSILLIGLSLLVKLRGTYQSTHEKYYTARGVSD